MFAFSPLILKLIDEYEAGDPLVQRMFDNIDWYIVPSLNVDGYIHTWTEVKDRSCVSVDEKMCSSTVYKTYLLICQDPDVFNWGSGAHIKICIV